MWQKRSCTTDNRMKLTHLVLSSVIGLTLLQGSTLLADDPATTPPTRPPVVIPPGDREAVRALRGATAEVRTLIQSFDATRDRYLAQQRALLAQLKNATPEQRQALRQQLQENRESFLAELKTFRTDLRKDLADLRPKLNPTQFRRIIDAARDAATDSRGQTRKGQK